MFIRSNIETIISSIILIISSIFIAYIYIYYFHNTKQHYTLYAEFNNTMNLFPGAKIVLSGVEVGYIDQITLNNNNYTALTTLCIEKGVTIPVESSIRIVSSSLLGGELLLYIEPNMIELEIMQHNDYFTTCYSPIRLDSLINKFAAKFIN